MIITKLSKQLFIIFTSDEKDLVKYVLQALQSVIVMAELNEYKELPSKEL